MFYNGKNVLIKINDEPIFATEAQLTYEAQIAPYFEIDSRYATEVTPENTIQGTFNFTYYFTGEDKIKKLLPLDEGIVFDFGGIKQTGYIKNYTARLTPHSPVSCNTDIVFFRSPVGNFTPVYSTEDLSLGAAHINNVTIYNFNNQYVTGEYLSANFTYSADIRPEIYIGDEDERRGVFGVKETVLNIVCDNLNPLLEVSGYQVGISFGVGPMDSTPTQGYAITGFLTKKTFQAKTDDNLISELTIRQFSSIPEAEILGFSPISGQPNEFITITGENFQFVTNIFFGNNICEDFSIVNSQTIQARIPRMKKPFDQQIKLLTLG